MAGDTAPPASEPPNACAGAIIGRLAVKLRDDPDVGLRLVAEWAAAGAAGDLAVFLAGADSRAAWLTGARVQRDRALRQAAERYRDLTTYEAARLLARARALYRAGGWQADRAAPVNPHPAGSFRFWLWESLSAIDRPLSAKQITRIISGHRLG